MVRVATRRKIVPASLTVIPEHSEESSGWGIASVILALRQYPQVGGTGIDRYGAASPRFMGDLTWIGM